MISLVEDPSENFQRVRDFVDAKNCSKLACFQWEKLKIGYSKEMEEEVKSRLKLNRVCAGIKFTGGILIFWAEKMLFYWG